jgi:hypothetical protein
VAKLTQPVEPTPEHNNKDKALLQNTSLTEKCDNSSTPASYRRKRHLVEQPPPRPAVPVDQHAEIIATASDAM